MKITPSLIRRYHAGLCTPEEAADVERWLKTGEGEGDLESFPLAPNEDLVGNRMRVHLNEQLHHQHDEVIPITDQKKGQTRVYWAVAAVILVLFGIWSSFPEKYTYFSNLFAGRQVAYDTVKTLAGQKKMVTLADGSQVKLNAGSQLIYPKVFTHGERKVVLEGEGYFTIVSDSEKPFRVEAGNSLTEVLGTVFNLNTFDGSVGLAVMEGKVRFSSAYTATSGQLVLTEGQAATLTSTNRLGRNDEQLEDQLAWTENRLVFNDELMDDVARKISRWFGVNVTIVNPRLRNTRYTGLYENPELGALLKSLESVLEFRYERNGKEITIK